jgi:D-3-phosphoglycerate dehydrogenase
MTKGLIVVLDSLLEDISLENEVARQRGFALERWRDDDRLTEADIVLHVRTRVDAAIFARLDKCKVIGRYGTGLDTVDAEVAKSRGILLVNVRDYCVPELSAHTLGLILALGRAICSENRDVTATGSWQSDALARDISPIDTIGIVGLGSVGRTVCAAAGALGLSVLAVSGKTHQAVADLGATKVELPELLAGSDVVTLHVPLLNETAGLIGAGELDLMRTGSLLVDTARIGLIDAEAVAGALVSGHLGGLGLDARLAVDSPIARVQKGYRVIITPHVGWYSERSASVLRRETVSRSIDAFEQTGPDTRTQQDGRTT